DLHLRCDVGQDRWRVEVWTKLRQTRAACERAGTKRLRFFYLRLNDPKLPLVNHRADVGFGILTVAHPQLSRFFCAQVQKLVVDRSVHIAALDRKTCLSGVDESSPHRRARGDLYVGVVENQHGVLAAQFEQNRQQARGGGGGDFLAGENTSGEDK